MKITVSLNPKSIKEAIKTLKAIKRKIPDMVNELLNECADWVIKRANENLALYSDVGINVIQDISDSWTFNVENGKATIINTSDKAVFVEFGVGIVGESTPHPMASKANYEYNVESTAKSSDGEWHFFRNAADLDLPQDSYHTDWVTGNYESRNRMHIWTRGATGAMYAYNALMDLVSSNKIKELWEKVKKRYL